MSSRELTARHVTLHAVRVVMLVVILLLIRWQYESVASHAQAFDPPMAVIASLLPDAARTEPAEDGLAGSVAVFDTEGRRLGTVLQTSPAADHIIGFSGPTNVLLAFDTEGRALGMKFLSSGDTRDHLKQVAADTDFMHSIKGMTVAEIANGSFVDSVSGATLTSLAICESLTHRLGGANQVARSLRFPDPPTASDLVSVFRDATSIDSSEVDGMLTVANAAGEPLGSVLRTSPTADNVIGYQGPTDALVCFGVDGRVVGVVPAKSYDNDPYVGYVREDEYFRSLFNDRSLEELASIDVFAGDVEGVSGATMTSMAVTEGMVLAARAQNERNQNRSNESVAKASPIRIHDVVTGLIVLAGMAIGMTRLRSNRVIRIGFQLTLVIYLGFIAGNLVSQAMLVGWARHGVPWKSATGLVLLCFAALALPITTRRNLYCTHLCPHGALQQLARNRIGVRLRLAPRLRMFLSMIPALLLAWCVIVGMTSWGFSLVDIEAFDAYLFPIAGWATICVAVGGLVASLFVPMAYCRFGCPTGALLQFLRFNASSDRWSSRDWLAVSYVALAVMLWLAKP